MIENNDMITISNESTFIQKLYALAIEIFVLCFGIWILYTIHIEGSGFQFDRGNGIHIPNFIMDIVSLIAILGAISAIFNLFFKKKATICFYEDEFTLNDKHYQYQAIQKIKYEDNTLSITIDEKEIKFHISITYGASTIYKIDKLIEEKLDIKLIPTIKL